MMYTKSIADTYEALLTSIQGTAELDNVVRKGSSAVTSFVQFINKNKQDISVFKKATEELTEFLNNYDFHTGYDFSRMEDKLSILPKIKNTIAKNEYLLSKFKTFHAEMQQYMREYPLQGTDNLSVVEKRIAVVQEINSLIIKVEDPINYIKPYNDRYKKDLVIREYESLIRDIYMKLSHSNADTYKKQLNDLLAQAREVQSAFMNEKAELDRIKYSLGHQNPDMWKEDNQKLSSEVSQLLKGSLAQKQFDIDAIRKKISAAKAKRKRDIQEMMEKYAWLGDNDHKSFHDGLIKRFISYEEYKSAIEKVDGELNADLWKKIFKVVGILAAIVVAILAIKYIIAIIVGVAVIWIAIKVLASSSSDD